MFREAQLKSKGYYKINQILSSKNELAKKKFRIQLKWSKRVSQKEIRMFIIMIRNHHALLF